MVDEGGPDQEMQQLVMYSDYGNADHAVGNLIESNLFQEQVLPAGCSGTWTFTFDAKMGNLGGSSTALAFIKILNPADWSTTMYSVDMTSIPVEWANYSVSVDVTGLDGMYLQFGFASTAANYEPCGIFYDNVAFSPEGTVAIEGHQPGQRQGSVPVNPVTVEQINSRARLRPGPFLWAGAERRPGPRWPGHIMVPACHGPRLRLTVPRCG